MIAAMTLAFQISAAAFGLASAYFWIRAAMIRTPNSMGLTVDMTNFDWLTKPLTKQAIYNSKAAICAAVAALSVFLIAALDTLVGILK